MTRVDTDHKGGLPPDRWGSWGRLWLRVVAAFWLALTTAVAFALFFAAAITASADTNSTLGRVAVQSAVWPMFLVGLIAAAGPLGIWIFRRTRFWLVAGLCVLGLGVLNAFYTYARSI